MDLLLGATTSSASEDGTVDSVTGHGVDDSATGDSVVGSTSTSASLGEVGGLTNGAEITASGCATGSHSQNPTRSEVR